MAKDPIAELRTDLQASIARNEVKQDYNPAKQEGDTRQRIAVTFVMFYFILFLLILLGVPLYNALVSYIETENNLILSLDDTLLTFASVIGAPLGFVVGYYFKSKGD